MSEKLVFTPNEDDLRAAYGLHVRWLSFRRMILFLIFGIAMGDVFTPLDGFGGMSHDISMIAATMLWIGFAALVHMIIFRNWSIPRYAKKIYKQQKDLRLEITTWWDVEKFYSNNAQTQSHFAFADIVKWRSDDKIFLIYHSDQLFNFLPTRIFKHPSDQAELIRRLQEAGVPGEAKS
tara:strand:+ start:2872 stop:3405 length:534 start_codon:yes stop_codon:yes gene_type:complete